MARPGDRQSYTDLCARLRAAIPGLALRTTFIVGYPGETEDDFEELLAFMREVRFERVGVFQYSREEGTPAAALPRKVPPGVVKRRHRRAYECQQKISHASNAALIGSVMRVLVDSEIPVLNAPPGADETQIREPLMQDIRETSSRRRTIAGARNRAPAMAGTLHSTVNPVYGSRYLGRSEADAPEIDGMVFINGSEVNVGEFSDVRIIGAHPYYLVGRPERVSVKAMP